MGATANKVTTVAAGSTIIGFGAGVIFVSYPGIIELLPNKYRWDSLPNSRSVMDVF